MPDLYLLIWAALTLGLIGAFSGVIAGLLGVGGGIVLVPAFFYAFRALGYDGPQLMQICLGTSLATIVFTSIRSGLGHHRRGAVDRGIVRAWAPGIVAGVILGTLVAARLRSEALQAIFGALALLVGLYMAFGRPDWRLAEAMPSGLRRAVLSPMLGFLSVLMGIGGGTFGVPLMTLHSVPIHRAVGTASVFGLVIALPAVIGFLLTPTTDAPPLTLGAVNLPAFAMILAVSLWTTPLGVRLAHSMNPVPLRRVFAVFLILVALNMLRKVAGL
ncbi:MAG: sulfite exporter TauE/SafE family protein [Gemmobacter sp.]